MRRRTSRYNPQGLPAEVGERRSEVGSRKEIPAASCRGARAPISRRTSSIAGIARRPVSTSRVGQGRMLTRRRRKTCRRTRRYACTSCAARRRIVRNEVAIITRKRSMLALTLMVPLGCAPVLMVILAPDSRDFDVAALVVFALATFALAIAPAALLRWRRRERFREFGARVRERQGAICLSCAAGCVGSVLAAFADEVFALQVVSVAIVGTSLCVTFWQLFRAWPN